jgi:6-pyruvoyltetrahydropterin 2'-reductase
MIHHANKDLHFVIAYYSSRGHQVYVETNGTQEVDFEKYPIWKKVKFTLSVKMQNSGEKKEDRFKPNVVDSYLTNTNGSTFKFVLDKTLAAKDELEEFLSMIPTFAPVYLMPQGGTRDELNESCLPVYQLAMSRGYRYSDRLHIRVFDDCRGV